MIGEPSSCAISAGDLLLALLQLGGDGAVRATRVLERRGAPVLEGRARGRHGAVDVLGGALRDAAHDLLGGRVDDLDRGLHAGFTQSPPM